MKRLCIIFIVVILFTGCRMELKYDWQIPETITTIEEALDHVTTYDYVPKYGCFTPEELYRRGYGDCEDLALMLQYLFESQLNMNADFIVGYFNGGSVYHAWVESGGVVYEATSGSIAGDSAFLYAGSYRYTYPGSVRMVQMYGGFLEDPAYRY